LAEAPVVPAPGALTFSCVGAVTFTGLGAAVDAVVLTDFAGLDTFACVFEGALTEGALEELTLTGPEPPVDTGGTCAPTGDATARQTTRAAPTEPTRDARDLDGRTIVDLHGRL
jgi:hypothetical protein